MKTNDTTDGWTSECPTEPGVWEFRCDTTEDLIVQIKHMRGKLLVSVDGEGGIPLDIWHEDNPQWRRHLGGIESPMSDEVVSVTPETDKACFDADNWNSVVLAEFARSLETRLAAAERALKSIELHDGPGYPHGTCAKIAREALAELEKLREGGE